MDAAIAACAVQCVVEPGSTGIGGDCFCLYAPEGSSQIVAYNGSGKAPASANLDNFHAQGIDQLSPHSAHCVTIPGAIDAWHRLNADHGVLEFGQLLQPAIDYAENGYPITSRVSQDFIHSQEKLRIEPSTEAIFLTNGNPPNPGERHHQPILAKTLKLLADHGRDAFYHGSIARHLTDYLQSKGGVHELEDFAGAAGEYVDPIHTDFRGYKIHECPPNGQGMIALLLLNIMADIPTGENGPIQAQRLHQELEACKLAYGARTHYLADPKFSTVPVEQILDKAYAQRLRAAINPQLASHKAWNYALPDHKDTVYITVVDKDRNAVSFINSLFMGWGSGLTEPNTGIVLHNRGYGFSMDPESPNCIEGGKRPLHTLIPGVVTKDQRLIMPFGVMGGQYQAMGHMQFLTRLIDYGLDIQEAMDLPRVMADPFTGEIEYESSLPDEIVNHLKSLGHTMVEAELGIGGSQAIWIDWENNMLTGGSDPRKDGCAIGY